MIQQSLQYEGFSQKFSMPILDTGKSMAFNIFKVADCSETKKEYCCIEGERYAREIVKDPEINFDELDPEITCAGEALRIAKLVDSLNRFKYSHSCVYHFYLKCKETISEELLYGKCSACFMLNF